MSYSAYVRPPDTAPRCASPAASELFLDKILERIVLAGQLSVHFHISCKLCFRLFEPLELRGTHAAVLRFPVVVRRVADAVASADVFHFFPASASFRIDTIWVSVNRLRFMVVSSQGYPAGNSNFKPCQIRGSLRTDQRPFGFVGTSIGTLGRGSFLRRLVRT